MGLALKAWGAYIGFGLGVFFLVLSVWIFYRRIKRLQNDKLKASEKSEIDSYQRLDGIDGEKNESVKNEDPISSNTREKWKSKMN